MGEHKRTHLQPGVHWPSLTLLAVGHVVNDMHQGAVPALLPFLVMQRGLSLTAAAGLVVAATVLSSLVQPLLGHVSDRRPLPWLMPLGVFLGGVGITLTGIVSSYGGLILTMLLTGMGVAIFPEAARCANYVSGTHRATGMSVFAVGGNAGFALGPVLVTMLVVTWGIGGTLGILIPASGMAAALLWALPQLRAVRRHAAVSPSATMVVPPAWGPFIRLTAMIILRSAIYFGLTTFVPLYYVQVLYQSTADGTTALSVMLLAGAVGTLVGGRLADTYGRRRVLVGSFALLPLLLLGFMFAGPAWAYLFLAGIGAVTIATFSVAVVLGQEYLPNNIGIASGVTLGLAIGLGGVGVPLLGLLADRYGLGTAFVTMAALSMVAAGVAGTLPPPPARGEQEDHGSTCISDDPPTVSAR